MAVQIVEFILAHPLLSGLALFVLVFRVRFKLEYSKPTGWAFETEMKMAPAAALSEALGRACARPQAADGERPK